jgi:hypothetical protein
MLTLLFRLPRPLLKSAFIAAVLVVFALTLMPLPDDPGRVVPGQVEHAIAFLVLMLLGAGGWPGAGRADCRGAERLRAADRDLPAHLTTNRFGDPWDCIRLLRGQLRLIADTSAERPRSNRSSKAATDGCGPSSSGRTTQSSSSGAMLA